MVPSDTVNTLDKWKAKFGGLGQLTDDGARQHFEFGRFLRHRYAEFLPEKFSAEEFGYRSSDFNRTKMSAVANLQGMFPAQYGHLKVPLMDNAPADLRLGFLPQGHDPIVFDEVECPAASRAEDALFNGTEFKLVEKANEWILTFLGQKGGFDQVPLPLRRIYYVHDPLVSIAVHQKDGFVLPEWANETIRAEAFRLYNLKNSFNYKDNLITRLWAGPMFTEIMDRMERVMKGQRKMKFQAYSGHDGTISGLLALLGINLSVFPTYANAVLLELHQDKDGEPFVRLFHRTVSEGWQLGEYEQIPGCGDGDKSGDGGRCTLRALREARAGYLIRHEEWRKECEAEKPKEPKWSSCGSWWANVKSLGCSDECHKKSETCFFLLGRRYLCC